MACIKRPLVNIAKRSYCAAASKIDVVQTSKDDLGTKVSLVYNAGSRFETPSNLGVTHAVRAALGWGNPGKKLDYRLLGHSCETEGINLSCAANREQLIYTYEGLIESEADLKQAVNLLRMVGSYGEFSSIYGKMKNFLGAINHDLAVYAHSPAVQLSEAAHKAAFGLGGLANSLYMPSYAVGNISYDTINDFMSEYLVPANASLVVSGVTNAEAAVPVDPNEMGMRAVPSASPYDAGEVRVETAHKEPHAGLLFEGASWGSKDRVALGVLAHALGRGDYAGSNLLSAASPVDCQTGVLNYSYSDTGLFCVCFSANCANMAKVADSVASTLVKVKSGGLTQADVDLAKAKSALATAHSCPHDVAVTSMKSPDQAIAAELDAINSISLSQVQNVAKKVLGSTPSMAAVGDLRSTPFLKNMKL